KPLFRFDKCLFCFVVMFDLQKGPSTKIKISGVCIGFEGLVRVQVRRWFGVDLPAKVFECRKRWSRLSHRYYGRRFGRSRTWLKEKVHARRTGSGSEHQQ